MLWILIAAAAVAVMIPTVAAAVAATAAAAPGTNVIAVLRTHIGAHQYEAKVACTTVGQLIQYNEKS